MLSEKTNYFDMINAVQKGLLKTSGKKEFEKAINAIMKGETFFSNELLRQIIVNIGEQTESAGFNPDVHVENLTPREKEVLQYFCKGFTVTEIAAKLFVSVKTIETHRSALLKKTNSKNTINLVLYAIKNKIVEV